MKYERENDTRTGAEQTIVRKRVNPFIVIFFFFFEIELRISTSVLTSGV